MNSPIGGFFELECGKTPLYYKDGVYLNICRSALRYLIRALGIKRIHVPVYTCHVVYDAIRQEGCETLFYSLDSNLMPTKEFSKEDFIIYNNYFGCTGSKVKELAAIYPNLIVDNAQAFYSQPDCRAAIYSPRKFFGLPDGGILRGKDIPSLELEQGHSFDVSSHLLKRHDYGAQAGYQDFCENDNALEEYPLERMSKLTKALMGNIDYENVRIQRLANFRYLQKYLLTAFPLSMASDDVPMVYPLMIENGSELRDKLIRNGIFCARYWPNVLNESHISNIEYDFTMNVVPIPIDQRYGIEEMERVIEIIRKKNNRELWSCN